MTAAVTGVPIEALVTLRRRLAALPGRHPQREASLSSTAELYVISRATLYRLLRGERRPRDAHRADPDTPRVMPASGIERWCEIIASMKVRTTNRKGRHLPTVRIFQLLVEHGVETPDGLQKLTPGRLTASTINRHMRRVGYDHDRMTRQLPAVRFQAEHSNALWHFDMSPSDLKQLPTPPWIDPRGKPAARVPKVAIRRLAPPADPVSDFEAALAEVRAVVAIEYPLPFGELREVEIAAEVDLEENGSLVGRGNVPGLCSDAGKHSGSLAGQPAQRGPMREAEPDHREPGIGVGFIACHLGSGAADDADDPPG